MTENTLRRRLTRGFRAVKVVAPLLVTLAIAAVLIGLVELAGGAQMSNVSVPATPVHPAELALSRTAETAMAAERDLALPGGQAKHVESHRIDIDRADSWIGLVETITDNVHVPVAPSGRP